MDGRSRIFHFFNNGSTFNKSPFDPRVFLLERFSIVLIVFLGRFTSCFWSWTVMNTVGDVAKRDIKSTVKTGGQKWGVSNGIYAGVAMSSILFFTTGSFLSYIPSFQKAAAWWTLETLARLFVLFGRESESLAFISSTPAPASCLKF